MAERLIDRVRTTVSYLAPNHPDADDLVQRALIEILRSAGSFRGESALETWADRIASRTAMRLLKQRARHAEVVTLVAEPEPEEFLSGEDEAAKAGLRTRLAGLLSRLSPERRAAVVLHYVHGYSVQEISEITETPANTVRDRLRVGKALLRKYLLKDSGTEDEEGGEP
jgi:RNA polymerase sigma-70 factor (ECF subfamily)